MKLFESNIQLTKEDIQVDEVFNDGMHNIFYPIQNDLIKSKFESKYEKRKVKEMCFMWMDQLSKFVLNVEYDNKEITQLNDNNKYSLVLTDDERNILHSLDVVKDYTYRPEENKRKKETEMTNTDLIEKKDLREQLISRVEVLDKVKGMFLIRESILITPKMIADFYKVGIEAIQTLYKENKKEIDSDGTEVLPVGEAFGLFPRDNPNFQAVSIKGGKKYIWETSDKDGNPVSVEIVLNNRGTKCFSKRAVLRFGMLLRDSEVAKEVRTQLLNTFEHATVEQKTFDINEENSILMNLAKALTTGTKEDYVSASKDYFDFQNRHISKLEENNTELSQNNKALAGEILEWEDRASLNKAVRTVASIRQIPFGYVWKELYEELRYKHGIGLSQRGKSPYIQYIKEDEWKFVIQSLSAICEDSGVSVSKVFEKAKVNV